MSFHKLGFTKQWINGTMSSFEYLMILNQYGGRTFLDIGQYPVFPWIIACQNPLSSIDKEKKIANSENNIRNLSLSIAGYTKDKREVLELSLQSINEMQKEGIPLLAQERIQHYSLPVNVLEFLQRLEPFSSCKDRGLYLCKNFAFNSLPETWFKAINESNQNCELIPEFFYLPQLFLSSNFLNILNFKSVIEARQVLLPSRENNPP